MRCETCGQLFSPKGLAIHVGIEHTPHVNPASELRNIARSEPKAAPRPLGLREALVVAIVDLPQPTLGRAGGVNRGAVIDAINREFAALRDEADDRDFRLFREYLIANLMDGEASGFITMSAPFLADEVSSIVADWLVLRSEAAPRPLVETVTGTSTPRLP